MIILLQSVAANIVAKGILTEDHISDATGLDPAITISKNGGNFANPAAGASVMTEIQTTAWYKFALGTADTDTLGPLIVKATHDTMDPIEIAFQVVAATALASVCTETRLAELDAENIPANVDAVLEDTGTTLNDFVDALPTLDEILAGTVEDTVTVVGVLRAIAAYLLGKASGGETTEITFRDSGDNKDRIVLTVDSDGNRSAVTFDLD
jgi:hypothetical protein